MTEFSAQLIAAATALYLQDVPNGIWSSLSRDQQVYYISIAQQGLGGPTRANDIA